MRTYAVTHGPAKTAKTRITALLYRSSGPPSVSIYMGRHGLSLGRVQHKERQPGMYGVSFRLLGRLGALLLTVGY